VPTVRWQLAAPRIGTRLGVIVPSSNTNLEPEAIGLLPRGAWAHFNRIGEYAADSVPDLGQPRELATCALESRARELREAGIDVLAHGVRVLRDGDWLRSPAHGSD
jgi:maleate isomerase